MGETRQLSPDAAGNLHAAWQALNNGRLQVHRDQKAIADALAAAPLMLNGLVNTKDLSDEVVHFGCVMGRMISEANRPKADKPASQLDLKVSQQELFQLFAQLFSALTGINIELISGPEEIKQRMIWRFKHEEVGMEESINGALHELGQFYEKNAASIFQEAAKLGGLRLVSGGQRTFGPSALNAVRITGLYGDTQLIPDPVYPFLTAELYLNAKHLQLANTLFYLLQLRPLVDAGLNVPPVIVFPSFEEALEQNDATTKIGQEQLALKLIGPLCKGTISSLDELFEYAARHSASFAQSILTADLFIPPGGNVGERLSIDEAVSSYLEGLRGIRSNEMLAQLSNLSPAMILLNGVLERLRPHYHLLENADAMRAQPLLTQAVHWHYFEKCANANALDLCQTKVISEQTFLTLRAVQDDSLNWLATIPIPTLVNLIANGEHKWLREELVKYTSQLHASGSAQLDEVVREVTHGLASIAQRQQRAMNEIERKYEPKKKAVIFGALAGGSVAATVLMLPMLAPLLGVTAPFTAAAAALGGGATGYAKEKIGERSEKRQAQRSMIGVLATIHQK